MYLKNIVTVVFFSGVIGQQTLATDSRVDFATEIKPLLSDRCFLCHGPDADNRQASLRLDAESGINAPLESDETLRAVVPGKPEASELIARVFTKDQDLQMPPVDSGLSLNEKEKRLLKRWIAEGAEWKGHWAFEPIVSHTPPAVAKSGWGKNEIDQFIAAQHAKQGLIPNGPATKERLIRRATFDLIGLPPSLQEIDDFLADSSSNAFEKVLDRLLASPHFGERMAADWLDVARYSDTYGYQVDRDRFVWPWRDWVINSFNANMPYDRFITEQLAGDLLPNATRDQILATTFNRLHPQKVEGGSVPEEFRVEYVADRAQTVGTAFMGLTFECARCHDHKYDPITQREYYQLFSFFNNIDEAGLYSFFTPAVPTPTLLLPTDKQQQEIDRTLEAATAEHSALTALQQRLHQKDGGQQAIETLFPLIEARLQDRSQLIPGRLAHLDFESGSFGANSVVEERGGKAVRLTGDHAVDVKVGNFPRWQPFTISTWLNSPSKFERSVVFHRSRAWTDAGSRGYELLIENGRLSAALIHFWPGNAIRIQSIEPIPTNIWQHVSVTYDGSSRASGLQIWLNGELLKTKVVRDNLYKHITGGGGDNINIGQRFRDIGFAKGLIDDFQVFNRELTRLELMQVFDGKSLTSTLKTPEASLSAQQRIDLVEYAARTADTDFRKQLKKLRTAREGYCKVQDALQEIMVMSERPVSRQAYVLTRGAYDAHGDEVASESPAFLPAMDSTVPRNRLGLAQWLTSDDHPLTARVTVNRFWQMLFGHGLVRSPEDFGSQGLVPSHPQLLDWLAADFRSNDWNVKNTLKQIMLSATYQQSSRATAKQHQIDPENQWLARAPVFRLSAEMLRDNALSVSGLLRPVIGGAPAKPYELAASFKPSTPDKGDGLYRRSLYTYWKRTAPAPVMMALDASKREVCRVKRERTASPLQALVVMNGPQFVEASRVLAGRMIDQHGSNDDLILVDMFRLLTGRKPEKSEFSVVMDLLRSQEKHFATNTRAAGEYLAVGDTEIKTENSNRLAAWASVANALFAFDECMMKR